MQPSYADIEMLIEEEEARWLDKCPHMPMVGFAVGTGLSLMLWGIIGWGAWALLA